MAESDEDKAKREAAEKAAAEKAAAQKAAQQANQPAGSNAKPAPVADDAETDADAPAYKSTYDQKTGTWTRST